MVPKSALDEIRRWADRRVPKHARDQIRLEVDVTDRTVTILECRPPWRPECGPDWTRFPIARLRYTKSRNRWSLYWRDQNLNFRPANTTSPTPLPKSGTSSTRSTATPPASSGAEPVSSGPPDLQTPPAVTALCVIASTQDVDGRALPRGPEAPGRRPRRRSGRGSGRPGAGGLTG
ncbi:MAG: DUF3024 domain-containing protein [Nitriliruptoraceae bacterium]|nr:DUF3024 domain-containing protein [Nitriliruptoraceae bacterium]